MAYRDILRAQLSAKHSTTPGKTRREGAEKRENNPPPLLQCGMLDGTERTRLPRAVWWAEGRRSHSSSVRSQSPGLSSRPRCPPEPGAQWPCHLPPRGSAHRSAGGGRRAVHLPACFPRLSLSPGLIPDPAAHCVLFTAAAARDRLLRVSCPQLGRAPGAVAAQLRSPQNPEPQPPPSDALAGAGAASCSRFLHETCCSCLGFSGLQKPN